MHPLGRRSNATSVPLSHSAILPHDCPVTARERRSGFMSGRPFKVVGFVPQSQMPWRDTGPRWADILATAQLAEEVGFDSLWLPDHLLFEFDNVKRQGAWDVWSLLAGLAAATRRIELAPLVACTSFRNP